MKRNGAPDTIIRDFRNRFLKEPVVKRLSHYDGLMQSVAEKLGKKLKPLHIHGGETLLFTEPYHGVFASLVHVFRNAVDHGIEPPDERQWVEKDEAGQISLKFEESDTGYKLTIEDDGQGIDPDSIRKTLSKTHPDLDTSRMSERSDSEYLFAWIFLS